MYKEWSIFSLSSVFPFLNFPNCMRLLPTIEKARAQACPSSPEADGMVIAHT